MKSSPRLLATVSAFGLVAVALGGSWQSANQIQKAAGAEAAAALEGADLTEVTTQADGADVVIVAGSGPDTERARQVLEQVDGIAEVRVSPDADSTEQAQPPYGQAAMPPDGGTTRPGEPSVASEAHTPSPSPSNPAESIEFEPGSADLTDEGRRQVAEIVRYLSENPTKQLATIGIADDATDREHSLALSSQRAKKVTDAVVAGGISSSRVFYTGSASLVGPDRSTGEGRVDVSYEER